MKGARPNSAARAEDAKKAEGLQAVLEAIANTLNRTRRTCSWRVGRGRLGLLRRHRCALAERVCMVGVLVAPAELRHDLGRPRRWS